CNTVHPRMRGEHLLACLGVEVLGGSSPHARGTRTVTWSSGLLLRFIPACAGNTLPWLFLRYYVSIHPRMRGEHGSGHVAKQKARGSSPHARGTLPPRMTPTARTRFIPACAGNTLWARR